MDAADDPAILNYFDQSGHYVKAGEIRDVCSDWAGMDRRTISVYQAQDNLGDAWVVSDYIWNDTCDREEILQRISEEDFRMDRNVFVDRCELGETEKRDLAEISPEAREYSAAEGSIFGDGIRYHVNTDTSGILVTAELAYPGWEVCVNGEKRTTLTVDGTNRGVVVPAGESEVEFLYRPWELRAGMALQLLAAVWIGALLVHAAKNRGVKHAGAVPCFGFCRFAGRKEKSGRQGCVDEEEI